MPLTTTHRVISLTLIVWLGAPLIALAQTVRPVTAQPVPRAPRAAEAHRTASERATTAGRTEHSRAFRQGLFGRRGTRTRPPEPIKPSKAGPPSPDRAPARVPEAEGRRRARRLSELLVTDRAELRTFEVEHEVLLLDARRGGVQKGKLRLLGERPERGLRRLRVITSGPALGDAEFLVHEGVGSPRVWVLDGEGRWQKRREGLATSLGGVVPLELLLPFEADRYRLSYERESLHDGALAHRVTLRGKDSRVRGAIAVRESDRTVRALTLKTAKGTVSTRRTVFTPAGSVVWPSRSQTALTDGRQLLIRRSTLKADRPLAATAFLPEP